MQKNKINWCCTQKKGIILTELKPHLSDAYIKEADETLENVFTTTGKWKVITSYYACYNALYAILMNCGIKSEIHDCTIELMKILPFDTPSIEFMEKLKEDRIQTQYYLKNKEPPTEQHVKQFIITCKNIRTNITTPQIEQIRKTLENKEQT